MHGSSRLANRFGGKTRWTLLAAALIALTLAGCGGRSDGDDEDEGDGSVAANITLEASSTRLSPLSSEPVEVTATLRDSKNNLVEGVDVDFSADNGTLTATQPTTNDAGQALAELLPGDVTNGTITVTAEQGNAEATIQIEVAPIVSGISLSASSSRLPSTGDQTVEITALLRDSDNNAVEGAEVDFSADAGVLTPNQPTTNASGEAIAELAPGDMASGAITVSASRGEVEATIEVEVFSVDAPEITLEASSTRLTPSSGSPVEVTATLKNSSNILVEGVDVDFSTDNGSLTATQPTTNDAGQALAELLPGDVTNGTITVTAEQGNAEATIQIEVAPIVSGISLSASSSRLPSTGDQTVEITALLRDSDNNAVEGAEVDFSADAGVLTPNQPTTNASGEAIAELAPGDMASGAITVSASRGDVEATIDIEVFSVVADVSLRGSGVRLASSGNSPIELTALLRDSTNNVVEGADVQFQADSGAIQTTQGTTQAAGQATAELRPQQPANRTIEVTASAVDGNVEDQLEVEVFGTRLEISGPTSLNPGSTGEFSATLQDSAGNPIAGQPLTIESEQINTITPVDGSMATDASGRVEFELRAQAGSSANDTLRVSALGTDAKKEIEVSDNTLNVSLADKDQDPDKLNIIDDFEIIVELDRVSGSVQGETIDLSTTRGTLSDDSPMTNNNGVVEVDIDSTTAGPATIQASADVGGSSPTATLPVTFVATEPDALELGASPSQIAPTESSTITARVRDSASNLVANQTVNFNLVDVTTGSLASASAVTGDQGEASTVYTAADATSAADAVEITAQLQSKPAINDTVRLTVGGEALRLSLNTGNELEEPNPTQYREPWTVLVTDASGNPVANSDVDLSINPLAYYKGEWVPSTDNWVINKSRCSAEDTIKVTGLPIEDTRFNGQIDNNAGDTEDVDGDGMLEPSNTASVAPGEVTTDDSGFAQFDVAYPQGNAEWSRVRLTATVSVAGSERTETREFDLRVLADDVVNLDVEPPGGTDSPFGLVSDCTDPG